MRGVWAVSSPKTRSATTANGATGETATATGRDAPWRGSRTTRTSPATAPAETAVFFRQASTSLYLKFIEANGPRGDKDTTES